MPGDDVLGFTPDDRKTLIKVELELGHVVQSMALMNQRLTRVEDERVTQSDYKDLLVDIDELRHGKADKAEIPSPTVKDHEVRLQMLEKWSWMVKGAFGASTIAAIVTILNLILGAKK